MWRSFAWQVKWTISTPSSSPCGSTVVAAGTTFPTARCGCDVVRSVGFFFGRFSQGAQLGGLRPHGEVHNFVVSGLKVWRGCCLAACLFFLRIGTLPLRWTASTSWPPSFASSAQGVDKPAPTVFFGSDRRKDQNKAPRRQNDGPKGENKRNVKK